MIRWVGMWVGAWVAAIFTGLAMGTVTAAIFTLATEGPKGVEGIWVVGVQISVGWLQQVYKLVKGDVRWIKNLSAGG